jgi:hypothetical protein
MRRHEAAPGDDAMSAIPVFIPYVNRPDLLMRAVASVPRRMTTQPEVINNSDCGVDVPCKVYTPDVPLTFAQTQNLMLKLAEEREVPFYLFMHNDAEAGPETIEKLYQMALRQCSQRKWGAIFTAYDALAAFSTAAMGAIGGWDTMLSWYCADNDCYRRLRLAGYPTIESNLPVSHEPSRTLNADPAVKRAVDLEIPFRESYYRAKWGGSPGNEKFDVPWNGR